MIGKIFYRKIIVKLKKFFMKNFFFKYFLEGNNCGSKWKCGENENYFIRKFIGKFKDKFLKEKLKKKFL